MQPEDQPEAPSLPWRAASATTMGIVGLLCKGFLNGLSTVETNGMDKFLKLLDAREDIEGRRRGLLTGMRPRDSTLDEIEGANRLQSQITSACTYIHMRAKPNPKTYTLAEWMILYYGAYYPWATYSTRTICAGD